MSRPVSMGVLKPNAPACAVSTDYNTHQLEISTFYTISMPCQAGSSTQDVLYEHTFNKIGQKIFEKMAKLDVFQTTIFQHVNLRKYLRRELLDYHLLA